MKKRHPLAAPAEVTRRALFNPSQYGLPRDIIMLSVILIERYIGVTSFLLNCTIVL